MLAYNGKKSRKRMSRDYLPEWAKEIERNIDTTNFDSEYLGCGYPQCAGLPLKQVIIHFIYRDMNKLLDALNSEIKEKHEIEEEREERHE